jgi:hypothetical protein
VELAAQVHSVDLEIRSGSRRQRQQVPWNQPLAASPTYDQADAGIDAIVIATTTAIAAARTVISAIGRDITPPWAQDRLIPSPSKTAKTRARVRCQDHRFIVLLAWLPQLRSASCF